MPPVVVSLSEHTGAPIALLGPRVPHVMVGHHLSTPAKVRFHRRTGYLNRVSRLVVLCTAQKRFLVEDLGMETFVNGIERVLGTAGRAA